MNESDLYRRAQEELMDSFDEELEMELDDDRHNPNPLTPEERKARRDYFTELIRLQSELIKLQDWVVLNQLKVVVLFEGRDAAGKGGTIKRFTQRLNPRVCRVVALSAPSERERSQWYFQRYISNLPAAGEIVLFDRSWYNRAGVERVMGFCTTKEYDEFMKTVNSFEAMLVGSGLRLIKYYLDISKKEQAIRLLDRKQDPLKQWKISPIDQQAQKKWLAYSKARDVMLKNTNNADAPWTVIRANDKKVARINLIQHLLSTLQYPDKNKKILKFNPQIVLQWPSNSAQLPQLEP